MNFFIHSTFRDANGIRLVPKGLQWNIPGGTSYMTYVAANIDAPNNGNKEEGAPTITLQKASSVDTSCYQTKRAIVEAHNRWSFAKDLPFQNVENIERVTPVGEHHFNVTWNDPKLRSPIVDLSKFQSIPKLLSKEEAKAKENTTEDGIGPEVWINGEYVASISSDTMEPILQRLSDTTSTKLCYKKSAGLIRIERYFVSYIRGPPVFEHIMDNLYALEDPKLLDDTTLIGTATLNDWIMGGNLTSRIYVQEKDNGNILFLRPLRNDDIGTSDRRYELKAGVDDDKIARVRPELRRLRLLATLEGQLQEAMVACYGFVPAEEEGNNDSSLPRNKLRSDSPLPMNKLQMSERAVGTKRGGRQNRRKFFGF
eukprot:CAMPEP_0183703092 /NCGR_PEP_ID=MMETSP0737-20130205/967_1 /TAXON_ID=385413 /ORGANISM="Thalassiosira miniscula, Strain CCMP1093" /LENGTH=368 /DNA_ID=CAMNT_0025929795 /DNA_START=116 /DNA_END=1222 /DNA_ORIENTATION=-